MAPLEVGVMALVSIPARVWTQRRWRWSWLWFRWEVRTLSEDYVFHYDGAVLWGTEPWEPM